MSNELHTDGHHTNESQLVHGYEKHQSISNRNAVTLDNEEDARCLGYLWPDECQELPQSVAELEWI